MKCLICENLYPPHYAKCPICDSNLVKEQFKPQIKEEEEHEAITAEVVMSEFCLGEVND